MSEQITKHPGHPDVPRPSDEELVEHAVQVCHAIEACGASPELTHAVTVAGHLVAYLQKSSRPESGMTFGQTIEAMKMGKRVARSGWNGSGLWVEYVPAHGVDLAYLQMSYPVGSRQYPNGARVPWLASQTDMLAEDWQIV